MKITQTIEKEVTWADIKTMADNGEIKSVNLIPIPLKNGEKIIVRPAYDIKGKLFFVLKDRLFENHAMNKTATNKGGWAECDMRGYLNKTIFSLLPDELQAFIKPTKIVQVLNNERIECEDKLFLLSRTQAFGKSEYSEFEPEDTQLDIFNHYKKRRIERYTTCTRWWLRSPYTPNDSSFWAVDDDGDDFASLSYANSAVIFGFCIN